MRSGVYEVGTVDDRHDLHAMWQSPTVKLLDLRVDAVKHRPGALVAAQQHDAFHGIVDVWVALAAPPADLTQARLVADAHRRNVSHAERRSAVRCKHHVLDVPRVRKETEPADYPLFAAALHVVAASIAVGAGDGVGYVLYGDFVLAEFGGVDEHLVLAHRAAEAVNIRDPGNALELSLKRPVLQRLQLFDGCAGNGVPKDFAGGARHRRHGRIHVLRQCCRADGLVYLFAGEVVVDAILKREVD